MHFPRRKSASVTTATIKDWASHPRETPIVPSQLNHREHSIVQGIWVAGTSSQHRGSSAFAFAELALVHNLLVHARVTNWKPKWGCNLIGFILLVPTLQLSWALGNTQNKHCRSLRLLACFQHSTDDLVELDRNVWCEAATQFHLGWLMTWKKNNFPNITMRVSWT